MVDLWDRLIVALDLDSEERLKHAVGQLSSRVKKFKLGPVAFVRFGLQAVSWVKEVGADLFFDFKFYDIPNTMIEAGKALVDLGIWAFTVHLKSGEESLFALSSQIAEYAEAQGKRKPLIFGVTELTSKQASFEEVLTLAKTAKASGIEAIVCSVWEAERVKKETGLLTVTPGIRKEPVSDDQKRTATLQEAKKAGVDYFVVGRPILKSSNPLSAATSLIESAGK